MKKTIYVCDLCEKNSSTVLVKEDNDLRISETIDICNKCFDTITLFLHESVFIKRQ
jgi:hypothetical protein